MARPIVGAILVLLAGIFAASAQMTTREPRPRHKPALSTPAAAQPPETPAVIAQWMDHAIGNILTGKVPDLEGPDGSR